MYRCVVSGLCDGRAADGAAHLPRRLGRRPAGGDHQGAGHSHAGPDPPDEPQLHGVQVPADQEPPLVQGR